MFILWVLFVAILNAVAMEMALTPAYERFIDLRKELVTDDLRVLSQAIQSEAIESARLNYLDLDEIADETGYSHLRFRNTSGLIQSDQTGVLTNNNGWGFVRLGVWYEPPGTEQVGNDDYLDADNNACGNDDFDASASWCGRPQSLWAKLETSNQYEMFLQGESVRLKRTISKFYRRYSAEGDFTSLPDGTVATLASLTSPSPFNAANCQAGSTTGVYMLEGVIPLTCDDLFNHWGVPITLNVGNENRIALVNNTEIIRNGQRVRLAEEAILE